MPGIKQMLEEETDGLNRSYVIYEHFSQILHGNPTYIRGASNSDEQVYRWGLLLTVKAIAMLIIGNYQYLQKIKTSVDVSSADYVDEAKKLLDELSKSIVPEKSN